MAEENFEAKPRLIWKRPVTTLHMWRSGSGSGKRSSLVPSN
jgi:hypothetical protein